MPTLPRFTRKNQFLDCLLIGCIALITLVYWQGVAAVPFHPDESTYLYMSADWEQFTTHPTSLAYQENDHSKRQQYRLLDPPLTRYLIGISRSLAGIKALIADWDWSLTWDENKQAGALPAQDLLTAGRFGSAALLPFSLALIYLAGWRLGGRFLGWSSMLLLATNALVLLHTRRAMSEGGLVFTVCLFMAGLVFCRKRPWLIGIPAALMVCAKLSTLPLAVVGLLAIILYSKKPIQWKPLVVNAAIYALVFLAVFITLNPVFWKDPWQALQAAVQARQDLLFRQALEFELAQPETVLNSPWKAVLSLTANLFITPPAFAEVGNYLAETHTSTQKYLANPTHLLFRDIYLGGLMLALSMVGYLFAIKNALNDRLLQRRTWILLVCAALVQFLALIVTVALPFQRYVMPLVPFTCLWIGYSLLILKENVVKFWLNRSPNLSG